MSESTEQLADRPLVVPRRTGRRSPLSWALIAATLLGLGGWFAVRLRSTLHSQRALAAERTAVAQAAARAPLPKAGAPILLTPKLETWQPEVQLEGTLQPQHEADLGFVVQGRLRQIRVKLGDHVTKGQTLATLDDTEAQAQVRAAAAQVRAAEAQLGLASDSARRTSRLVGSGAAAQATGVQSTQQRSLAEAQLDSARAQLALAQAALANHVLKAPFAGAVTKVPSGPGAIVSPGGALFRLQDTTVLKLAATIGEADAPMVKAGAPVEVQADGRRIPGRVVAVLGSVDAATRRVPVEAQLDNRGPRPLFGGAYVRAAVMGLSPVEVLRLPGSALRPGSQNEILVAKGGQMHLRRISFSRAADGALLVRGGLQADEQVVAAPSAEARDGDPITPAARQ